MPTLSENTRVTLGLAVAVIGGGAVWLTALASTVQHNSQSLADIRSKQDQYNSAIQQIQLDLTEIKVHLGVKRRGKSED
jgi:hypothetical protein